MKRYLPFIIIIAVAALTAGGGVMLYRSKMHAPPPASATIPAAASPAGQAESSESLHARGEANAPATLEIYGDFQCPSCATASAAISQLEQNYGGRLRVIFWEFPLAMHEHSVVAAMAAEAAGLQGRFWEMHDMLYQYQSVWSKASNPGRLFSAYAASLGLDVARFDADANSSEVKARVITQGDAGVARGVKNTPTIFINGGELRGAFTRENLQTAIDAGIAGKKQG